MSQIFDYLGWEKDLSKQELAIYHKVGKLCLERIDPVIDEYYENATFPHALVPELASLGMCGSVIPRKWGGPELSCVESGLIAMQLGRTDAGLATFFSILQPIAMISILNCGTTEQKSHFLPLMAQLKLIGCFCLTEPLAGSDAAAQTTTARQISPSGWRLDGEKRWIGNAPFADVLIVWANGRPRAQSDSESKDNVKQPITGFIVEREAALKQGTQRFDVHTIQHKLSLRCVQNGHVQMNGLRMPESARMPLCRDFGSGPAKSLFLTRVMAAWIGLGAALAALKSADAYMRVRKQFGVPLSAIGVVAHKFTEALAAWQACLCLCLRVSRLYDCRRLTLGKAAMLKAHVSGTCRVIARVCREVMGGNGIVMRSHTRDKRPGYGAETGLDCAFKCMKAVCDMESVYTYEGAYDINVLIAAREWFGKSAIKPRARL